MANWIIFVFIAQGIWSITSLIDKIVISKGYIRNPLVYIVLNGLTGILLVFLLPFVGFESLKFADFFIALLAGALFSASVALYYKAVQFDDISRVIILMQIAPIFVLILSYFFLGETLTGNHLIGFLLLLGAGIIVSFTKVQKSFRLSKAFWYMLFCGLLGSISFIMAKYIFTITSFWNAFLWLRLSGFMALVVLAVPSIRIDFVESYKKCGSRPKGLLAFKMIIDFSAFVFAGYALVQGKASLISALSSSITPIFVFVLTAITSIYLPHVVKEEINTKAILTKIMAILLIVAGIIFINF